jgi:hypothetical protein
VFSEYRRWSSSTYVYIGRIAKIIKWKKCMNNIGEVLRKWDGFSRDAADVFSWD